MKKNRVLIIDDEALVRKTTLLLLKKVEVDTIEAASGKEGIEKAENEHPDIILLDLMMPEMDGWECLEQLKNKKETKDIPVIIFTAVGREVSDKYALDRGASAVLRKPFHLHQLLEKIELINNGGEV